MPWQEPPVGRAVASRVFLPEFPPAMFLQNRPELGDVSRGEVVSINNYYRLFKDLLTPVQLDGLRLLVQPYGDRK